MNITIPCSGVGSLAWHATPFAKASIGIDAQAATGTEGRSIHRLDEPGLTLTARGAEADAGGDLGAAGAAGDGRVVARSPTHLAAGSTPVLAEPRRRPWTVADLPPQPRR